LCLPGILEFKFLEGLIHCHEVKIALNAKIKSFIQRQSYGCGSASFVACACDPIADQNSSHRPCRERNNMRFVTPDKIWPFEHAQERFVEQGGRLEGMTRTLASEIFRGQAAQRFVRFSRQFTALRATACVGLSKGGYYYVVDLRGPAYHNRDCSLKPITRPVCRLDEPFFADLWLTLVYRRGNYELIQIKNDNSTHERFD
jgi:hypothetical protein